MRFGFVLLAIFILLAAAATAQNQPSPSGGEAGTQAGQTAQKPSTQGGEPAPAAPPAEETPGREMGNYLVHQSIEIGGRLTDLTGSQAMYNTLVNVQEGARVLEQSLSLQSRTHTGNLFDSLYASSFGWGGDPSNAGRLRISKLRWYNFTASFRRDKNYFDYDLFANPLNFTNAIQPNLPVNVSPHAYFTTRRMYDFDLVLGPQRRISGRLGYSRNKAEGPSFNTFHEGTEPLLFQNWNNTLDALRFGLDVKPLQRTTLSFTETLQWAKIDTPDSLFPLNDFQLATTSTAPFVPSGVIASFGVPWQPGANNPCGTPLVNVAAQLGNPGCNVYINYSRTQRLRNFMPTEQLSLASSSIRRVDVVARVSYSTADANTPMTELFNGLVSRTLVRQWTQSNVTDGRWISVAADLGVTFRLTDRLRLVDSFRFHNWRKPATENESFQYFFNAASAGAANATLPIATFPTPLLHNLSSNPDLTTGSVFRLLKNDTKSNQIELQYDLARFIGVRVGYRFAHVVDGDQELEATTNTRFPVFPPPTATTPSPCFGQPAAPCVITTVTTGDEAELETLEFTEHSAILGLWIRPTDKMHFNFDANVTSSGDIVTRISPRHQQQYRADFAYTPQSWLTVGANLGLLEQRNHDPGHDIRFDGHVRNFGFDLMIAPNDRVGVDAGYNFAAYQQNANVCFTPQLTGVTSTGCVFADPATAPFETLGFYDTHTHFGSLALRFNPLSRVKLALGYGITNNDGNILILNVRQPHGTLRSRYQQPLANVGLGLTKDLWFNAGWNYYQYNEDDFVGSTAPRYFHSNITTLSLRYAF